MSALSRFEGLMQEILDGRVVRLFGGGLQPVELAQRMSRCMEMEQRWTGDGPLVPNHFTILLHPNDYADVRDLDGSVERKLADYAVEVARERGFNFPGPPRVRLVGEPGLGPGQVQVRCEVSPAERRPALAAAGQPALAIPGAEGATSRLTMAAFPFRIGRREGNDLVLADRRVSREHAVIERRAASFYLLDLGSRNGTLVNGQPVQEVALRHGDALSFGGPAVTFLLDEPS
ncbi:MAG: FhaA domain-containing protein [Chloroflexota bacterium]